MLDFGEWAWIIERMLRFVIVSLPLLLVAADPEAFIAGLRAEMTGADVDSLASRTLPPDSDRGSTLRLEDMPSSRCFELDPWRRVVIEFPRTADLVGNIRDTDRVGSWHLMSVRDSYPVNSTPDQRADLDAVHLAPAIQDARAFRGDRLLLASLRLHARGREAALAAMRSYLTLGRPVNDNVRSWQIAYRGMWGMGIDGERIILLCRMLFSPKDANAPWRAPALA